MSDNISISCELITPNVINNRQDGDADFRDKVINTEERASTQGRAHVNPDDKTNQNAAYMPIKSVSY